MNQLLIDMSEGADHKKQEERDTTPSEPEVNQEANVPAEEDSHKVSPESQQGSQIVKEESPASEETAANVNSEEAPAHDEEKEPPLVPSPEEVPDEAVAASGHHAREEEKDKQEAVARQTQQPAQAEGTPPGDVQDSESNEASGVDAHDTEDEHDDEVDYSNFSKVQLVKAVEDLLKADNIKRADRLAGEIKVHFDELEAHDRQLALDKFLAEGGSQDDFDYKSDELTERFYQAYRVIKERKSNFYAKLNQDLNQNYETKLEILNRIRELVDSDETQVSINKLKELQTEWRSIGRVPPQHNRNLWANYHALINRFYDNRSIYFELKELDRKKNLESKLALCEKAETLAREEDLKKALRELDELHEEYKHIGPIPKEEQEPLWQRFKTASDRVHDRRRAHVEQFKENLNENLEKKLKLYEEVVQYADFQTDSIKEWNQKTKEVQDVQKRWEAVGPMPREKAKEVNKKFWSSFKQFFAHKGEFFKKLDAQREENLKKKENLLAQAEQFSESNDWQKTAHELKRLQREWKEIGPVPEKQRNEVYKKFKAACDTFFERKRESNKEQETEFQNNLEAKEAICEQIEKLAAEGDSDTEKLHALSEAYADIGFVPRNAIKKISRRYEKALNLFMNHADELDEQQKEDLKLEMEVTTMKGSPMADRKLDYKETALRKKISRLEEDISLWKNNISFFANSKQADKLRDEYERKIEDSSAELAHMKSQLNKIENLR